MEENQKKAFDFAADVTKQLITLSTGIVALMITFSKDMLGNSIEVPKTLLMWIWITYIISIVFGIGTLSSLTGTLQPLREIKNIEKAEVDSKVNYNIYNFGIRFFSGLQIITFLVAISLTVRYGVISLNKIENEKVHDKFVEKYYKVVRKSILNSDSTTVYTDTLLLTKCPSIPQ